MLADRARPARADDVARSALVALLEHHLPGLEPPRHHQLCHLLELLGRQRREDRNPPEQLDRVLAVRRHRQCIPHALPRRTDSRPGATPGSGRVERLLAAPAPDRRSRPPEQGGDESDRDERGERDQRDPGRHGQHAPGVVRSLADAEPAADRARRAAGTDRALISSESWLKPTWRSSRFSVAWSLEIDASASRICAFRLSICSVVVARRAA